MKGVTGHGSITASADEKDQASELGTLDLAIGKEDIKRTPCACSRVNIPHSCHLSSLPTSF